jgi:hypothetical protein
MPKENWYVDILMSIPMVSGLTPEQVKSEVERLLRRFNCTAQINFVMKECE